jgi:aspartyl-tRNA(Asn)/glutamyl-tRNA(Gln) amidotransferase subunit A
VALSMQHFDSIENYHRWLESQPDGCEQAVRHYQEQIRKHENLNAFLEVYAHEATERAKGLDRKRASGATVGKLHGVVVSLKDVIAHRGHILTAASRILEGYTSIYNATVVEKLLAEEANLPWAPPTRIPPMDRY